MLQNEIGVKSFVYLFRDSQTRTARIENGGQRNRKDGDCPEPQLVA